ncbi:hypothetical protein BDP27DRAFT_1295587 [Rhodocollybia butyracea]|uniref:Golgi apparatus membrane protein TVP23 n=1 Tax=Rhodocollybia butyracea TaxID=206335 RepID=A0A9P5PLP8_9AGAR|nr:hypothetical protein BDP27DRAFT_1295587 [Rhodocollybia butyracea]
MSVSTPLLDTIEPDEPSVEPQRNTKKSSGARQPVVLTEGGSSGQLTARVCTPNGLFFLYFFRTAAITVYVISGFFTDNYVLSTVVVVVLLAADFWNCRNVSGRSLVGLRFWNTVDDDGESYWVFESRDPSRPANPIDSKMFWIALYVFPALWSSLLVVSILKLGLAFIPIVILALVFNMTNVVGFTYADRDAKQRWANNVVSSGWSMGMGGLGGQLLTGAVQKGVGRIFS